MQTIYIDVYFLINFTVDLLSMSLAAKIAKIKVSPVALLFSSFLGGVYAVILVFIPEAPVAFLLISLLFLFVMIYVSSRGCTAIRKIKLLASFLISQILIGGMVYFFYGILERGLKSNNIEESSVNRNLLMLGLIVLLSIGVLRLSMILFRKSWTEKSVKIKIVLFEKEYITEAFVDSGNLAIDPMDLAPIMLVKSGFGRKIFPYGIPDLSEVDAISEKIKKRIRVIPISTAVGNKTLCGIRPDSVFVLKNQVYEKINLTIAFDKEGGSYGGFEALIPMLALDIS